MFITWPNVAKTEEIWTHVKNKYKFPKVIGAVDGTHVKIAAPKLHADAYVNRKGYHSIQLQVFFLNQIIKKNLTLCTYNN